MRRIQIHVVNPNWLGLKRLGFVVVVKMKAKIVLVQCVSTCFYWKCEIVQEAWNISNGWDVSFPLCFVPLSFINIPQSIFKYRNIKYHPIYSEWKMKTHSYVFLVQISLLSTNITNLFAYMQMARPSFSRFEPNIKKIGSCLCLCSSLYFVYLLILIGCTYHYMIFQFSLLSTGEFIYSSSCLLCL